MKKSLLALLYILIFSALGATQSTPLVLTEFPTAIVHPDSSVVIKWTGTKLETASIYYSLKPGGSVPGNYSGKISLANLEFTNKILSGKVLPERGIKFKPSAFPTMGTGIFYLIVASDDKNYSNEIKFIVKNPSSVQMITPVGSNSTNVTPMFKWKPISGVPYYHVIVTDEKIETDKNKKVTGLSVIWQAITSSDGIVYGAPDPSGTITASPPPLSPGVNYSWFVLNNYGNNAALSAFDMKIPSTFALTVDSMKSPQLIWPLDGSKHDYRQYSPLTQSKFTLKWTNLDPRANTYKVYLYANSGDTTFNAKIAIWDGEVTAGSFKNDTGSIEIDARNILTTNGYRWKVIAVNSNGKGQASKGSSFHFDGLSGGVLTRTYEQITTASGVVEQKVGLAEIKVEVLNGSMEKPLLFFTDANGYLYRSRPVGTYRLTAVKEGFKTATKTVTIANGDTARVTFYLERPDASIYGLVIDEQKTSLGLAKVIGVSTFGDSVVTESDPSGNFVLNCGKGDWDITVLKGGYVSPLPVRVTADFGKSIPISAPIIMTKNSFSLSGKIVNAQGTSLTAAKVVIKDQFDAIVGEIPSTNSTGDFSFSLNAGTYSILVTKTGFTSYSESFQFASSAQKIIKLTEGAAQIKGSIYGRNWSKDSVNIQTIAPIRNLTIKAYDSNNKEVASSVTDVWGSFTLGVEGKQQKYTLKYGAPGFNSDATLTNPIASGTTVPFNDTIDGLGNLYGSVRFSSDESKFVEGVLFSLSDSAKDVTIASGTSDKLGSVELYQIPDGVYRIKAAGNKLFADSIVLKTFTGTTINASLVKVEKGRLKNGQDFIQHIRISVIEGKGAISWNVKKPLTSSGGVSINVISPLLAKVNQDSLLSSIGLGSYRVEVNATDQFVLDCSRHVSTVSQTTTATRDTIYLPFSHVPPQSSTSTISLSVETGEAHLKSPIKSAVVFYRTLGASTFASKKGIIGVSNSCSFALSDIASGSFVEYYFVITLKNGDEYGYSKELYRTFVESNKKILSRIEVIPVADTSGYTLPLGGSMNLEVRGYYGNDFSPAGALKSGDVEWQTTGVLLQKSPSSASATLTAPVAGSIIMNFTGKESGFTLGSGVASSDTIAIAISTSPLDSLKISRVSLHENDLALNSEGAQFTIQGYDQQKKRVHVSPKLEVKPDSAGSISEFGKLTLSPDFMGRIQVLASVNDSIRDLFKLSTSEGKQAPTGMLVAHAVKSGNSPLKLSDKQDLSIVIPASSVTAGTAIMTADNPEYENKVFKTIPEPGISLVSKIYQIQLRSAKLNDSIDVNTKQTRASKVRASIGIPEKYKKFADQSGSRFTIAAWNSDSLKWQYRPWGGSKSRADSTKALPAFFNSIEWNDTIDAFSISIGDELNAKSEIQLAVLFNETENVEGDFHVSPNPFSPYVSPENDYIGLSGMNNSVKGTCLKIIPMNSTTGTNPDITVHIYTANRTLVWETQLSSAIPGKEYFIFWDGKTRIGRSKSSDLITTVENKVIYPRGDEMCRNGRYFAVVTIDDSKEIKRFTKEIILFK